jgi:hypothetical protein
MAKTRGEVQALKDNWESDPCCDVWETEGFEEYEAELRLFQEEREVEFRRLHQVELLAVAKALGVNVLLADYILKLEVRIDRLRSDLDNWKAES